MQSSFASIADRSLRFAGQSWFSVAVAGQWVFVVYIVLYFGPLLAQNGTAGLAKTHLPHGFVAGDLFGNLAIAGHILIAAYIIGAGTFQLIPAFRSRFPKAHRLNGRMYLSLCAITSIAGLYLVWTRGVLGGTAAHIAIGLDAILILSFSAMTLRFAMTRRFDAHHRWALRLYMVVNAVWFFRIGFTLWMMLTGGIGIDFETFTGPAIVALYFGQMIVPLAFLELYLWASSRAGPISKGSVAIITLFLAALTAAGSVAATLGMWLPRLI